MIWFYLGDRFAKNLTHATINVVNNQPRRAQLICDTFKHRCDRISVSRVAGNQHYTMMLFQFFYRLIQGQDAERLHSFTQDLNSFIYSALQYVTFNTDEKPFPFSDWPAPDKAEDGPNYY